MKQKVSKILSLICALALIVSCVSVGFVVSAAEATLVGKTSFSVPTGTNHFASGKLTVAETDGTSWNIRDESAETSAPLSLITDGVANTTLNFRAASNANVSLLNGNNNSVFSGTNRATPVAQQTNAFLQVTVDLNGTVANPEKFYYAAHKNNKKLISAHYSIFASDTLYDLYDAENCCYTHVEDAQAGTALQHTIDISPLNLTAVKYFGIRFYNRDNNNYLLCVGELGLYGGTYTASNVGYTESMDAPADDATYSTDNHLKANGTVTYMVNNAVAGTAEIPSYYYDGEPSASSAGFGFENADNSPFQDDTYMQYEYTLDDAINNPETFFFASGTNWPARTSQRWTLFASSDKASLYNDESIVYEYLSNYGGTNTAWNNQPMEQTLDISDLSLQNIKYVAIRFYHRSHAQNYATGGHTVFVSEMGLYGGEVVETVTPTVNLYLGAPVLENDNIKIEVFMSGNNAEMSAINYKVYSVEKLTPVTVESGTVSDSYVDGTENVPITFDAQGTKFENPEDFDGYTGFQILNESYCEATLASGIKTAEGKIAEVYFAAPDTPGTYTFKLVGISGAAFVENATDVQDYVITVGEDVAYTYAPTASHSAEQITYTSDTDYTTYGVNYLKYSVGEGLATDGTNNKVLTAGAGSTDGRIDTSNSSILSAGSSNTIVTADNNGTDQTAAYLQLEYTLNGVINNPEKIVFISHLSNGNLTSKHYAVFASSSIDTLYDEAIYEFTLADGETSKNTHIIDISKLKLQNIKYVAIRFYHRGYKQYAQHVEEFGIFGGTYTEETLDNLTVNSDLTVDYEEANGKNLLVYSQFTSSSSSDIAYSTKPDFSVLTDGSVAVGNAIQPDSGRIGEQGNMLQTESYLELKFDFYNAINNPEKLRIAFGSTETEGSASLHYAVYFLADGETIETTEKVYNYQVSTRQNGEHILALTDLGQIKSVVVRFYESESEALVISEIGLYGGSAELYISGSATSKDDDYTSVYGENLFKNASLTFSATDGTNVYDSEHSATSGRYAVITDNKSNLTTSTGSTYIYFDELKGIISNDYQQTDAYINMTFAMNGVINNPEKILLAFTVDNSKEQFKPSKHYAIYASDSLDKLYNNESIIVDYKSETRQGVEHLHDIKAKNLEGIKYIGIRWYERMSMDLLMFTEVALYGGEYQSALSLAGSVFLNAEEELDNYDIQYRVSAADLSYDTITDMGMVAGFKFTLEEKNKGATVNKVWATENLKKGVEGSTKFYNSKLVGAENLYFHILNSGSKDELDDRSGYAIYAIGYVTFTDTRGREISLWSNTMTKSSKQISRTQARDYYNKGGVGKEIADSSYSDCDFNVATESASPIARVREYVAEVYDVINSIYVDQKNGLDSNTGSEEAPLKTLDKAAENGKIIKVIGAYTLDGTERIGNADHSITIKGADANAAINATTMIFDGDATIDNITLNFQGTTQANESVGGVVYANCNAVTFGKGVTTTTAVTKYAYIYGGMYDNDGTTTDITVNGGEWYRIFGNTDKNSGTVSETNVTIGGNASVTEVFGASHYYDSDPNAQGNFTLTVSKANVTVNGGKILRVLGGGQGSKSIAVETNVTVNGGDGYGENEDVGMEVYGGGRVAGLKKSNVIINGGTVEQVFGGNISYHVSNGSNINTDPPQLNGETNVYIYGGTITRRIYGGCYNNHNGLSFTASNHVYGKTYVFIDDNENLNLILDSDELDNGICAHSRINVDSATYEQTAILEFATQAQYEKCSSKIGTGNLLVSKADAYTELRIAGVTQ